MRGFPVLRLVLLAAGLGLLGIPVWNLTRPALVAPLPATPNEPRKKLSYDIQLTSSAPARLAVRAANQPTAESPQPATSLRATFEMDAANPEDVAVFGNFESAPGPCALRVEVRTAGKKLAESTFWGNGIVEDVVTISKP